MKCEYCDSYLAAIPVGGVCPNCGGVLSETDWDAEKKLTLSFPEPPVGIYKDAAGYLEIRTDSVTFCRERQILGNSVVTIPFDELYRVSFGNPQPWSAGFLCVRSWQDRHTPLAEQGKDAVTDETSVYFREEKTEMFFRVYSFLWQCAEIVRAAYPQRHENSDWFLRGKYRTTFGYMELGAEGVTFYDDAPLSSPKQRTISYSQIAEVGYRKAVGEKSGRLTVREKTDPKDLEKVLQSWLWDSTSVDFDKHSNKDMHKVYEILMAYVRCNNEVTV